MKGKKIAMISVGLACAIVALLVFSPYVYGANAFDSDMGSHLYVEVGVAGNFFNGTVYSPAAYAKGRVNVTIPNNGWYLYYHFEWEDMSHTMHYQESCNYYTNSTAGFQVRIDCTGLPSKVYYIAADARVGYGGDWDTRLVSASLPWA